MQGHGFLCRIRHRATVAAVLCLMSGCPAPAKVGPPAGGQVHPQSPEAVMGLYRGGRLAELGGRLGLAEVQADPRNTGLNGLLAAEQGRVKDGVDLLLQAISQPGEARCLRLDLALIKLYQQGNAVAALQALDLPAGADCTSQLAIQTENALRQRLPALKGGPAFAMDGPPGEQVLPLDRIATGAGYLVVRVIFDREHSGQFLLATGTPEMVVDAELARALHLVQNDQPPMPVERVPGLGAPGRGVSLPSATVPQLQIGLMTARNVPVLVGDFRELRDKFHRLISRDVAIDGVLPVQRLVRKGYVRLQKRGTELRVLLDASAAGPCRLQYPFSAGLYQIAGSLFVDGALQGSPPLLMRLDIAERWTVVHHSMLPYASVQFAREKAGIDVARPPLTEPEVKQRLVQVLLQLGQAQLTLHHVPLDEDLHPSLLRPEVHGIVGMDVPGEFDVLIDVTEGHLYLAPPGQVHC